MEGMRTNPTNPTTVLRGVRCRFNTLGILEPNTPPWLCTVKSAEELYHFPIIRASLKNTDAYLSGRESLYTTSN